MGFGRSTDLTKTQTITSAPLLNRLRDSQRSVQFGGGGGGGGGGGCGQY